MIKVCLFLFALSLAKAIDLNLDEIERELEESDFIEVDGSDVIDSPDSANVRARGLTDKIKEHCSFSSNSAVGCCAQLKMPGMGNFKVPACVNVSINAEEKRIQVVVDAIGNKLVDHSFPIDRVERVCDRLPGKLDFLKFCLYTSTTESPEQGLVSCSSFDVIVKKTTAMIINFSCIQFKDQQISFETHEEAERDTIFTMKFKNPIKTVFGVVKNMIKKKE